MTIIDTPNVPSENTTKYPYHFPKEFSSTKPRKMLMEYPSGYPTGAISTMSTENPSSKPRDHPISYPDVIQGGIQ